MTSSDSQKAYTGAFRWVIYDVGHTAFSMIVLAVLFPILFNAYWGTSLDVASDKTFWYSMTLATASILVAILSPILAAIAQQGGRRMPFFRVLTGTGIIGMATLAFIDSGFWSLASGVYIVAAIGFFGANLFYDSLLLDVASPEKRHVVSGVSFSAGYLGGVALLALIVIWTQFYGILGFESAPDPRILFAVGAAWWLVFALPLLSRKERNCATTSSAEFGGFSALKDTCLAFWRSRPIRWFMLAYFCYIDGVHTIITSAVRYGDALGVSQNDLFLALFIVQLLGIPCALLFGFFGKIFGARAVLFVALSIYIGVSFYGSMISTKPIGSFFGFEISEMLVLAALIGMVQGGVQALSRSFFATLIPAGREVSFFGFYSMIGRCSTILGPLILAAVAEILPDGEDGLFSTRAGMAAISLLFVVGIVFLAKVDKKNVPDNSVSC